MSDLDLNELFETFVAEAIEDIAALEAGLLALEAVPEDDELRLELQRHAHTLKGSASCVGLQAITDFAHAYEELLERITGHKVAVEASLINMLLAGIDTFRRLVEERENCALNEGDRAFMAALPLWGSAAPALTTTGGDVSETAPRAQAKLA